MLIPIINATVMSFVVWAVLACGALLAVLTYVRLFIKPAWDRKKITSFDVFLAGSGIIVFAAIAATLFGSYTTASPTKIEWRKPTEGLTQNTTEETKAQTKSADEAALGPNNCLILPMSMAGHGSTSPLNTAVLLERLQKMMPDTNTNLKAKTE